MTFEAICPVCGRKIMVYVDTSCGIPDEAGAQCPCGAEPVFAVLWEPHVWLGGVKQQGA